MCLVGILLKGNDMGKIYQSIAQLTGHTPLLEPLQYEKEENAAAHLLLKLEYLNPAGSIKDRAALNMILRAEEDGTLRKGDTIVEQTSGNTGIALAAYAAARGYHMQIFLEAGVTKERRDILLAYGCELLDYRDIPGAAEKDAPFDPFREATMAEIFSYCRSKGPRFHYLNQVTNPANPEAHIRTTGPEIWKDTDGKVDYLVCMAGTGGTITGLSEYLKNKNPALQVIAAEPAQSSRRSRTNPDAKIIDGVLNFDDIPEKDLTCFLRHSLYDACADVRAEDAYLTAQKIARMEGVLIGTSGAAALYAATKISRREEARGKNIIVIIPDGGSKYLSTGLYTYQPFECSL